MMPSLDMREMKPEVKKRHRTPRRRRIQTHRESRNHPRTHASSDGSVRRKQCSFFRSRVLVVGKKRKAPSTNLGSPQTMSSPTSTQSTPQIPSLQGSGEAQPCTQITDSDFPSKKEPIKPMPKNTPRPEERPQPRPG